MKTDSLIKTIGQYGAYIVLPMQYSDDSFKIDISDDINVSIINTNEDNVNSENECVTEEDKDILEDFIDKIYDSIS